MFKTNCVLFISGVGFKFLSDTTTRNDVAIAICEIRYGPVKEGGVVT